MKTFKHCLLLLLALLPLAADAQLSELFGQVISVSSTETSDVTTGQWYVIKSRGRSAYAYENGSSAMYMKSGSADGASAYSSCGSLVRFVSAGSGKYYIQTGYGNYLRSGSGDGAITTASSTSSAGTFTVGKINSTDGHFYMQDASTNRVVDANGSGSTMAYWGTSIPASTGKNNDWAIYEVTLTADPSSWVADQIGTGGAFRLRCRMAYSGSETIQYAAVNSSGTNVVTTKATSGDDAYRQLWIIEPSGSGYTLRNVYTGLFITSGVKGEGSSTAGVFYAKYSASNESSATSYVTFSKNSDFSDNSCIHHQQSGHTLVTWNAGTTSDNYASDWVLEPVTDFTTAEIREVLNTSLGFASTLTSGSYYKLYSVSYGFTAGERTSSHNVQCDSYSANDYTNLWKVTISGSTITLQNAVTDRYIQSQTSASSIYQTGTTAQTFTLNAQGTYLATYSIADTSHGLHCSSSQSNYVVNWDTSASASIWAFQPVTPDATILAATRSIYTTNTDLVNNAATYSAKLSTYFTDGTCTELRSTYASMSDAALTTAMTDDGLPTTIINMAKKVKNNSWTTYEGWDKTEKSFRVASYSPYSDYSRWTNIFKYSYNMARLTNPTGISASINELLTVYVGTIPSGQTLKLEAVASGAASGTQYTLTEGLNVIQADCDCNLFVYHSVDNTTDGAAPFTLLSNYSDITVHIEGGYVNGYFDLTKGDDSDDWTQLTSHLLAGNIVDIKSNNFTFHVSKAETVAAVEAAAEEGGSLPAVLTIWDGILPMQRSLQGLEEYAGYYNNPLSTTSPGSSGAHAANYGTYYNVNQLGFLMNSYRMSTEANPLWEAAHETGHIQQAPINMIGCTEISNNLFANVAIYNQGRFTSRTKSIQDTFSEFSSGISWLDRVYDNSVSSDHADLWQITHLYWQLYQFFHLAGKNTNFYPNLYKAFRSDPMTHTANTFVPASEDYLKFYKKCCQVSGYDLTELFEAYGFFILPSMSSHTLSGTTQDAHYVGDYQDYYVYATQAMIDAAKAEVAALNLPKANAVFIEDRIYAPDATYDGAASGTKKTSYANDMGTIGNCGETGQYTDFGTAISGSYNASVDASGNVTISGGSGAVGFKVYDADGNLAYLANTHSFTIPSTLLENGYTIKAAAGDGTDITLTTTVDPSAGFPFSTEAEPVYYYVQFKTGSAVLADKGVGNMALTELYEQNSDAQKWAFIGKASSFVLKSKVGNYLAWNGTQYTTASAGDAMTMVTSTSTGYYEMKRVDGTNYLNQHQGTGAGRQLREYTLNNSNNIFSIEEVTGVDTSLPIFTTPDHPKYYYAKFWNGGSVLADQGSGSNILTEALADDDSDQLWAFYGTRSNFTMQSKTGNYVNYASSRYTTDASGVSLALTATGNASATNCWEIKRKDGSSYMNMYGGAGTGKEIDEYNYGNSGNPISFVGVEAELPLFSTTGNEHWYFLQFCISDQTLRAAAAGNNVTFGTKSFEDAQLWKFVGTQSNFQLVSKTGLYASISGSGNAARLQSSTTADASGFSLVATTNSSYKPNWEIHWNGDNGGDRQNFNRWGGGETTPYNIGLWSANDGNNPFYFIEASEDDYPEFALTGISSYTPTSAQSLWYTQPTTTTGVADEWMEYALPIGNGQLGGSLFGGVKKDQVLINEKTVWTGTSTIGGNHGYYQPLGNFYAEDISSGCFSYNESRPVSNYVRELNLANATGTVSFTDADGVQYTREYIASYPANVVAVRYGADTDGKINLRFTFENGTTASAPTTYSNGTATYGGTLDLVSFRAYMKVVPDGGTMTTSTEGISVTGANEVVVYISGGTDFSATSPTFIANTAQLASRIQGYVDDAASDGWTATYDAHVSDYQTYFGRVNFQLDGMTNDVPTNELVDYYGTTTSSTSDAKTKMLEKLYFDYGRYLEISSSRGVDLPSNLQGIWNNSQTAPWHSDIHANINVQMNYWPAEPTNLSDMHLPFLNYIINNSTSTTWQQAATQYAGVTNGWTFFTENNIFAGMTTWGSNYFVANAWDVSHLWQHYLYTLDTSFLQRAFPAIYSSAQFWMERMIADRGYDSSTQNSDYGGTAYRFEADGTYVAPNEYSPEQDAHNSEDGTAHAQQLIYYNLRAARQAVDILGQTTTGLTDAQVAQLDEYIEKTDKGLHTETYTANSSLNSGWTNPRNGVNSGDLILREWKYSPYDVSTDPNHRHLSHLMALYPLDDITTSSEYFTPAVNSLKLRGDAATGWSMGWKVNLWARAQDGDHAHVILHNALQHSTAYNTNQYAGGVYYNLFDSHSPFQIDGNFGVCAGVAEMLLQSHGGAISILPALPAVWDKGSISGLKARGNFTVGITWETGAPTTATILSGAGQSLIVEYPGINGKKITVDGTEVAYTAISDNKVQIPATQGQTAIIYFNEEATTYSVEWNLVQDGTTVKTITTTHDPGTTLTAYPAALTALKANYVTFPDEASFESFTVNGAVTKDVNVGTNLPFTPYTASTPVYYYITLKGRYMGTADTDASGRYLTSDTKVVADAYKWAIYGSPFDGYVIRNKSDMTKALSHGTPGNGAVIPLDDTADLWNITSTADDGSSTTFRISLPGNTFYLNNWDNTSISYYSVKDGYNVSIVELAEGAELTWIISDASGTETYRTTSLHVPGTVVSELPAELSAYKDQFVSYTNEASVLPVTADVSKDVALTYAWSGPFSISNSTNRYYYAMKVGGTHYLHVDGDAPYAFTDSRAPGDQYRFYFTGDPFNGFEIFTPWNDQGFMIGSTLTISGYPELGNTASAWQVYNWNTDGTNDGSFALKVPGYNLYPNYHGSQYKLIYWNRGAGDDGSKITIERTPLLADTYLRVKNRVTGDYLSLKDDANQLYSETVAEGALTDPSTIFRFTEQDDLTYHISSRGTFITTQTSTNMAIATDADEENAYSCNVIIVPVDGVEYYGIQVAAGAQSDNVFLNNNRDNTARVVIWACQSGNARSHWTIEDADALSVALNAVAGGTESYATAYMPFSYTVPSGFTANTITVTGTKGHYQATATAIGDVVPAGTPVLLVSSSAESTAELTPTTDDDEASVGSNELEGTYLSMDTPDGTLVFSQKSGVPGFYLYDTTRQLKAYKAYILKANLPEGVRELVLSNGDLTSIDSIDGTDDEAQITYDLQGRRVVKPQTSGVYIVGGKKKFIRQ